MPSQTANPSVSSVMGELRASLDRTRSHWKRVQILQGFCLVVAVSLGSALGLLWLDHALALPMFFRVTFLILWAAVTLGGLGWWIWGPIRSRYSDERVAVHIESKFPQFENRLISAVQLANRGWDASPAMLGELVKDAGAICSQVNVLQSIDLVRFRYYAIALGLVVADLALYAWLFTAELKTSAQRYLKPTANIAAVHKTDIAVTPGHTELPPSADLEVIAKISGTPAKNASVQYRFARGGSKEAKMLPGASSDVFTWRLPNVIENVEYRVSAGDHTTEYYKATIVSRPSIANMKFALQYPKWTLLKDKTFESKTGDLSEPVGADVTLTLEISKPVKIARAVFVSAQNPEKADPREMRVSGKTASLNFKLTDDGEYSIELVDESGTPNQPVPTYGIRAIADEVPIVALPQPGEDIRITPTETIPVQIKAEDDFGLTKVALKYFPEGNEKAVKTLGSWDVPQSAKTSTRDAKLSPQELGLKTGQTIIYFAEAIDTQGGAERVGQSPQYKLQIVTQAEKQKGEDQAETIARGGLMKLIETQQKNMTETHDLLLAGAQKQLPPQPDAVVKTLRETQAKIRTDAIALAQNLDAGAIPTSKQTLEELAASEMVLAVKLLEAVPVENLLNATKELTAAVDTEKRILVRLESLLRDVGQEAEAQDVMALFRNLEAIIEQQIKVRDATREATDADVWPKLTEKEGQIYVSLGEYQNSVEQQAREMEKSNPTMSKGLAGIAVKIQSSKVFGKVKQVQRGLSAAETGKGTIPTQEEIIRDLQAIAQELKVAAAAAAIAAQGEVKKALQDAKERLEKLEALQQAIRDKTADIQKTKQGDHLTEQQKGELAELANLQQKVQDVVADIANDLAMVPDHDFTDHLNSKSHEIFEDVEMAKDAMKREATEIAVARDDAILDALKAEQKRVEDLEKWLPDAPDKVSWNMESFGNEEVPKIQNVDLPEELDDIVGDLLQAEDEMDQAAEDKASNWATADALMGWDAMDGPIANFSAKGVSGNDLPNNNEMGGRSGSGRSGKSSGEMVEDVAKALQGREKIADRRTDDPIQKGTVKEEDPTSKSFGTGGGKSGGFGQEGLQGKADAVRQDQWKRMGQQQAQARQNAQQLFAAASSMNLPTGELQGAIELMRAIENDIANNDYEALKRDQALLQQKLGQTIKAASGATTVSGDAAQRLPTDLQKEVLDARDSVIQPEYQPLIDDYFKALSEAVVK